MSTHSALHTGASSQRSGYQAPRNLRRGRGLMPMSDWSPSELDDESEQDIEYVRALQQIGEAMYDSMDQEHKD